MALPARAEGSRSRGSTRRSDARPWSAGKRCTGGSATGSTEEERMLARDALVNNPQRLLETGKPCASKGCMHGLGQGRRKRAVAIRYLAGVLCYSNLGDAVEEFLIRAHIRLEDGKAPLEERQERDKPLSSFSATPASQRKSQARLLRKWKLYQQVQQLHTSGMSLRKIGEELGVARNTVRKYFRQPPEPPLPTPRQLRASQLDPYEDYLLERWSQGERNVAVKRDYHGILTEESVYKEGAEHAG